MILLIFFIIIVLVIVIHYVRESNKGPKEFDNIPSVSRLPLVWGFLRQKPHDEIEDIIYKSSKGHDIYMYRLGLFKCITLVNPEYVKNLLMESADTFPKFKLPPESDVIKFFGDGITFSNGHIWHTYRKIEDVALKKEMSPEFIGETTMDLFTFMQPKLNQPIDVFDIMRRTTIELFGNHFFGYQFGCLKSEEMPHIVNVYARIATCLGSSLRFIFPWLYNKLPNKVFFSALKEFDEFIYDLIETKRKEINSKKNSHGHVDLLTSMLKLSDQEGIDAGSKQLRDEMVNLFAAGHETTTMAISASLYFLAMNPEMQEKARAEVIRIFGNEPILPTSNQIKELKYVNAVIKETLRIYPPSPMIMFRDTPKPVKIGPYNIPANSVLLVNIWQIHHDPKYWENPKQYDPERFLRGEKRHPFSWIPFSAGPRNCIGQNFTLLEQRVILSMFLLKYSWTLPNDSVHKDKLILESPFISRPVDLKLVFTERN